MTIYIQSRGQPQPKDYKWQKVRANNLVFEDPPILKRIRVGELIESKKYSLVVARNDGELVFLVTGLFGERIDYQNRQIRHALAWVEMDTPENDRLIRSLTVLALTNRQELEQMLNRSVMESDNDRPFEVDREQIRQLPYLIDVGDNDNADLNNYYGNSDLELQTQIGLELQDNCLPPRDGILVLLTTLKTESSLRDYNVWRGLSTKISDRQLKLVKANISANEKKKPILVTIVITVVILLVLIFN